MSTSKEYIGDPKFGIICWRNALPGSMDLVNRLECTIGESTTPPFMWMEALVGDSEKMPDYRDCVDCKIGEVHIENLHYYPQFAEIKNIYDETKEVLTKCLMEYQSFYNIDMHYMEAINYIRYNPGQHFAVHSDHGFSYNCTVSSVMFLNDDYDGGELWFPFMDIKHKPRTGDVLFFPSAFLFSHAALAVTAGTKYSAVTMFDWNDRTHRGGRETNIDGTPVDKIKDRPRATRFLDTK